MSIKLHLDDELSHAFVLIKVLSQYNCSQDIIIENNCFLRFGAYLVKLVGFFGSENMNLHFKKGYQYYKPFLGIANLIGFLVGSP